MRVENLWVKDDTLKTYTAEKLGVERVIGAALGSFASLRMTP
jgi:hypothetical protein